MTERKTPIAPTALVAAAAVSGAVFILYFCAISLAERELARGFALVWPIAGTILLACAAYPRRAISFFSRPAFRKRAVIIPLAVFAALFLSVSLVFFARIVSSPRADGDAEATYAIVLGGGVHRDGRVSSTLARRLETAAAFARDNPGSKLVVTGGQLPREPEPEADAMARWLADNGGIGDERILREREARDTIQNFAYSLALVESESVGESARPAVAVVTSEFHLSRSLFLARRAGLDRVIPLPAPSPALMAPNNYLREIGAWWKLSIRLALAGDAAAILELARGE